MEITNVKIFKENKGRCRAKVDVTIDDCFIIHKIRIIETEKGLLIAMPNENFNCRWVDICHPTDKKTRDMFTKKILEEYEKE